jgi:hypothetical protein
MCAVYKETYSHVLCLHCARVTKASDEGGIKVGEGGGSNDDLLSVSLAGIAVWSGGVCTI